jgi:hypothetical protein
MLTAADRSRFVAMALVGKERCREDERKRPEMRCRRLSHAGLVVAPGPGRFPWLMIPWGSVHADAGGLSRLMASSSYLAATVAPSVRIVPATTVARART